MTPASSQSRNCRVFEARQDLAFSQESAARVIAVQPLLGQLDGHQLLDLAIDPLGEPYDAHATFAELSQQAVAANDPPDFLIAGALQIAIDGGNQRCGAFDGRLRHEGRRIDVRREQLLDLLPQNIVATARGGHADGSRSGLEIQDRIEYRVDALPALSIGHREPDPFRSSR